MKMRDHLSIVLPVYNERESIEKVLREWQHFLHKTQIKYHFIICEDGSRDGTSELLQKIKGKYPLILNQKNVRRGYGGAVIDGIMAAESEYILCVDSDGQCDPKDLLVFWKQLHRRQVLIGWRQERADVAQRKLFSGLFKAVFLLCFPTSIHDPSAPFVLFRKSVIVPHVKYLKFLNEGFWWGFVGTCVKKGIPISDIPINHRDRFFGETQVYQLKDIFSIAVRNLFGLIRLRFSE